jgi:hypothetical protein
VPENVEEDSVAEQPLPFWRKIAEAVGLSEPELPSRPPLPEPPPRGAAPPAPATPSGPPVASPAAPPASAAAPAAARPPAVPARAGTRAAPAAPIADAADRNAPATPIPDAEALLELWFAREDDVDTAWRQCVPGPSVAEIATRLSLVPSAFLADTVAILPLAEHILKAEYGAKVLTASDMRARRILGTATQVAATESSAARRGAALVLWLWASDDVHGPLSVPLHVVWPDRVLAALAFRLAAVVDPAEWVRDADRRDEAARQFLFWSGNFPAGEDEATARSILAMRDSLQQNSALAQTLADHEHRLEVSRRLREARAREAAARYSSE